MRILKKIVEERRHRLSINGADQEVGLPEKRRQKIIPFARPPFIICEIKRYSPSRGKIDSDLDAVNQARLYQEAGITSVSVLTEQAYFKGSLRDLMDVKHAFPNLAVLRKDFLLVPEDVDVSYRAGADAVLLIASILEKEELIDLYRRTKAQGMEALVEVHSEDDIDKIRDLKPTLVGINARDLSDFSVDLCFPLKLKDAISWNCSLVFESGIRTGEDTSFAASAGFNAVLVGETVVRNPGIIRDLKVGFSSKSNIDFWGRLYRDWKKKKVLVKICGLTNRGDVHLADELGADILGFILAPSPRRVDCGWIRSLGKTRALKAGVVVLESGERLTSEVDSLIKEGFLDVIQFHGEERPEDCFSMAFPYYKALRPREPEDAKIMDVYRCPRLLVDAWVPGVRGGTGKVVREEILSAVTKRGNIWLAGGIGPDNLRGFLERCKPELVDASSRLEEYPGKKDSKLLREFFKVASYEG